MDSQETNTAVTAPARERIEMVYKGQYLSPDKKLIDCWFVLRGGVLGEERSYKKMPGRRPGSVWSVEVAEGTAVYTNTLRYVGIWNGDPKQIATWQIEHEAARVARDVHVRMRRELATDEFSTALAPIRTAYHRSSAAGRRAIIALVIDKIMNG